MEIRDVSILLPDPGEQIRPAVNFNDAKQAVLQLFGLEVLKIRSMNSYEDKNFFLQVSADHSNPHIKNLWPHGYVLKILNSLESQRPEFTSAQNELMNYLYQQNFHYRCPLPVANKDGQFYSITKYFPEMGQDAQKSVGQFGQSDETNASKRCHVVRLLKFVPGKLLCDVDLASETFHSCGVCLARLHKTMQGFHHSAFHARKTLWSLESVSHLPKFMSAIKNKAHQALVEEVIETFTETVPSMCQHLPKGLIHGDFNEQNILVDADFDTDAVTSIKVNGILDFADVQYSYYIFDVAIAVTYMMTCSKDNDPKMAGGYFLQGYMQLRPLINIEWDALKVCVAARLCQSLVLGAYNHALDPQNDYLLTTQEKGWKILNDVWKAPQNELNRCWKIML